MKFTYKTPEECGVPSSAIKKYLQILEDAGLSTHDIVMARGNDIFFEKYYAPFDRDYLHREYSVSKSYVSLAVGFAVQDGLMALDDPISKYFPEESAKSSDALMGAQTIKNMLMMSTPKKSCPPGWIERAGEDRVLDYFEYVTTSAPLGSAFQYDSSGSFVVGAAVEKVTGKSLDEYLREKLFCRIGASEDIRFLKCPGGYAWGDSAMLARAEDLLRTVRFLLDGGRIDGEQVLDEDYVRAATSNQIGSVSADECSKLGYGYLIWRTHENSFFFNGMGCQLAIGCPEKDMIFIINSDNQGRKNAKDIIIGGFFDTVYAAAGEPLSACKEAHAELCRYADSLSLWAERGELHSPTQARIDGKTFMLDENKMGISYIRFSFGKQHGLLEYANAQGEKSIAFGMCENVFGVFPEEGYSRDVGAVAVRGNYYKCASSASWVTEDKLSLTVQIIDEYFGNCRMSFLFEEDGVRVRMIKSAEGFLQAYSGEARGRV